MDNIIQRQKKRSQRQMATSRPVKLPSDSEDTIYCDENEERKEKDKDKNEDEIDNNNDEPEVQLSRRNQTNAEDLDDGQTNSVEINSSKENLMDID